MCPHTAVGHMAMNAFSNDIDIDFLKVTVATAHPAKFAESVERILRTDIPLPGPLQKAMDREKVCKQITPNLDDLVQIIDA